VLACVLEKGLAKNTSKEGPGENQRLFTRRLERGPFENHLERRPSRKSAASWQLFPWFLGSLPNYRG